ncbi:MAG: hypothetical protein IT184_13330 [Acidobacteria bacterium]|nr:hypothetical protein [Acidobacteriota bacterium]
MAASPPTIVALLGAVLAGMAAASHPEASPSVVEQRYVLNASIRPMLLFWIGRDAVGEARITWQTAGAEQTIELLVGTDPERAPRQINRWGYVKETVSNGEAEVIGLMTASDEQSLDEAKSEVDRRRSSGGTTFKGVQTTMSSDHAVTRSATLTMDARVSYRQLDAVLSALRERAATPRPLDRPAGVAPGFLFAMTSLIERSLGPCRTSSGSRARVEPVAYLYNRALYDASLLSCSYQPAFRTKTGTFRDVIDGRFEVRNRRTGDDTKFRIAYLASGPSSGRPVRAVFRPRWWLEAELLLESSSTGDATEAAR